MMATALPRLLTQDELAAALDIHLGEMIEAHGLDRIGAAILGECYEREREARESKPYTYGQRTATELFRIAKDIA
jgi:hypothetical protein